MCVVFLSWHPSVLIILLFLEPLPHFHFIFFFSQSNYFNFQGNTLKEMKHRETGVGIYKRKQESKKTRKHAFDQESDQEKKKKERKHAFCQESDQEKIKKTRTFGFLVESVFSFFILTLLFSFINSYLRVVTIES